MRLKGKCYLASGWRFGIFKMLLCYLGAAGPVGFAIDFNELLIDVNLISELDPVAEQLRIDQPEISRHLFSDRKHAIRVENFVFLPRNEQGKVPIYTVSSYEVAVAAHRHWFSENVDSYVKASAEVNTYWNRMTGTWLSTRGDNGKTAPEIDEDASRGRMLFHTHRLRDYYGVSQDSLKEYYEIIREADANNSRMVQACYKDLTRKLYTIPIMAFAAPVVLHLALPGAVLAGSGSQRQS